MASLGHIAVGMAAARVDRTGAVPRWSSMAAWSALSMLPDADVIGLAFGVDYAAPWGHRGATHSLAFALASATALALAAPRFRQPAARTWLIASVVMASHGLLDTLTDGGLGVALLWPFDLTRYFAPWRPIPVSPIGLDFLSPYGLFVASVEVVLFAPLLMFALRARRAWFLLPVWCLAVWLIASTDSVREAVLGLVLREDTEYAGGFSDRAFKTIENGEADITVRQRLGPPLGEWWDYEPDSEDACPFVYLESDIVSARDHIEPCARRGVRPGMSGSEVQQVLGRPDSVCWRYTRSPTHAYHRARVVCFSQGRVLRTLRRWQAH